MKEKEKHFSITKPLVPRKRNVHACYDRRKEYHRSDLKLLNHQHYINILDFITIIIKQRFEQHDYFVNVKLQNVIKKDLVTEFRTIEKII